MLTRRQSRITSVDASRHMLYHQIMKHSQFYLFPQLYLPFAFRPACVTTMENPCERLNNSKSQDISREVHGASSLHLIST